MKEDDLEEVPMKSEYNGEAIEEIENEVTFSVESKGVVNRIQNKKDLTIETDIDGPQEVDDKSKY